MNSFVLLKNKLAKLSQIQICNFLSELNDLSLQSVCNLSNSDTYFIRKKVGIYNDGESISDKELARLYELTVQDVMKKEKQLFAYVGFFIEEDAKVKLWEKVNHLEEKRNILRRVDMTPEHYIEISELHFSHQVYYLLNKMNIKTVFDLCSYSLIDLLKQGFTYMEFIQEVNSKLNYIGYSLKNNYSDYSYEELVGMLPEYARCIKNYAHHLGCCLKDENDDDIFPIEDLGLSTRSLKYLKREGVDCVGDLRKMSQEDVCNIRNIGEKSFFEIYEKLEEYNNKENVEVKKLIK